jgi:hypothetical protein
MSRGRWDRNKAARQQHWSSDYTALTGGLDQSDGGMLIKPGRISYCLNFEEIFGRRGYTTIKGYERYDGNASPSSIKYWAIPFVNGTSTGAPTVANSAITTDAGAGGKWVSTVVTSGSLLAGTAAGYIIIWAPAATEFANNDLIRYLGNAFAKATGAAEPPSPGFSFHAQAYSDVRNAARTLIAKVPGVGPVRGVAVFDDLVWAVRDDAVDKKSASLYYANAGPRFAGPITWQKAALAVGLWGGSKFHFKEHNFTGDAKSKKLFFVNGKNRLCSIGASGAPFVQAGPVYPTEATSTTSRSIPVAANTAFVVAQTGRTFVFGDEVLIYRRSDVNSYMVCLVNSFDAGTGTLLVTVPSEHGPAGGPYTDWEICKSDFSDKPINLQPHKNHMFLVYPRGQLQTSNLGDPYTVTTTASLFGLGKDITGMSTLKGKSLAVFCKDKIDIIEGSSQIDWNKGEYSLQVGAVAETVQDNDGNPIYLNQRGLTTLAATQNFGDVAASIFSRDVVKVLDAQKGNAIGSRMAFGNNQYRLYFADGSCLRMTLMSGGGAQVIDARSVSPSVCKYAHTITCFAEGQLIDRERMFFGTDDGYVMEEDSGTSFDGAPIDYMLRLPFNHFKSPGVDKQFHKMEVDLTGATPVEIGYRQIFDYDDGTFAVGTSTITSPGTGEAKFDIGSFDVMQFDISETYRAEGPLDGQGRNMALVFWLESDFIEPTTLQGILLYFSMLGVRP